MKYLKELLISLTLICGTLFAQTEQPIRYDDKGRRDPFLPLIDENGRYLSHTESLSFDELKLSGILWDPQGASSCLINNQIVKLGESICGFMLEDISKDNITLSKDGKEYIIQLSIEEKER